MLKDSGSRREFESGAVRDMAEGKGRCDLLPFDVVSELLNIVYDGTALDVFTAVNQFQETSNTKYLSVALCRFMTQIGWDICTVILEVAKQFEEGAAKYGDNNWRKGIPVRCYIDSAIRHYVKWLRGDNDEPHNRAFCWNIMCAMWTCFNKPELNDYASKESGGINA